jgi:hypothetical protein
VFRVRKRAAQAFSSVAVAAAADFAATHLVQPFVTLARDEVSLITLACVNQSRSLVSINHARFCHLITFALSFNHICFVI